MGDSGGGNIWVGQGGDHDVFLWLGDGATTKHETRSQNIKLGFILELLITWIWVILLGPMYNTSEATYGVGGTQGLRLGEIVCVVPDFSIS